MYPTLKNQNSKQLLGIPHDHHLATFVIDELTWVPVQLFIQMHTDTDTDTGECRTRAANKNGTWWMGIVREQRADTGNTGNTPIQYLTEN